jgi:hypothetical protein
MNDYTATKLHQLRIQEIERDTLIREALEVPAVTLSDQHAALARVASLVVRRRKQGTKPSEVEFSPRAAAVQCAES